MVSWVVEGWIGPVCVWKGSKDASYIRWMEYVFPMSAMYRQTLWMRWLGRFGGLPV